MQERKDTMLEIDQEISLIMPAELLGKIWYLCHEINNVEWSGLLFYQPIGDIKDLKTFKIIAKDVYLMDIGTSAYTEYSFNESIMNFYDKFPEAMNYKIAHIHSHNSMNSFFSSTDNDELKDNAKNYNYYLSLIVNNKMDMVAKLAMAGKSTQILTLKDNNGLLFNLNTKEKSIIGTINVNVFPFDENITEIEKRVKELKDKEKEKEEERRKSFDYTRSTVIGTDVYNRYDSIGYNYNTRNNPYNYQQNLFDNTNNQTRIVSTNDTVFPYNLDLIKCKNVNELKKKVPSESIELLIKKMINSLIETDKIKEDLNLKDFMSIAENNMYLIKNIEQDVFDDSLDLDDFYMDKLSTNVDDIFIELYGYKYSTSIFNAIFSMVNKKLKKLKIFNSSKLLIDFIEIYIGV
jgi:hypothetical protein